MAKLSMKKADRIAHAKSRRWKPGETCIASGQYSLTSGEQCTLAKGHVFPPTPRSRMGWKLTDATH